MNEIKETYSLDWMYIENLNAEENKKDYEIENKKENLGTTGKYLFFSDNKEDLVRIAKEILVKYNLYKAKVSYQPFPSNVRGFEFTLCIYDSKPQLKDELRKFAVEQRINYRYWKSNFSTIKGSYSKDFLKNRQENKIKAIYGEGYKIIHKDDEKVTMEWINSMEELHSVDDDHFAYKERK